MDKNEEIVSLLQLDFNGEQQAIQQYIQSSWVAKGLNRPQIIGLLMEIAHDEMEHLNTIGTQIVKYGGIPDLTSPLPIILDPSIKESMRIGSRLEPGAITQYAAHRDRFTELGEHGLVQLIETIMDQEQDHMTTFNLTED